MVLTKRAQKIVPNLKEIKRLHAQGLTYQKVSQAMVKTESWAATYMSRNKHYLHYLDEPKPESEPEQPIQVIESIPTPIPIPVKDIEPLESLPHEIIELMDKYAMLLMEYTKLQGTNEPRTREIKGFMNEFNTLFSNHHKEVHDNLVKAQKLRKGSRSGYSLPQ